jgi:hypothetical protein
MPPVVVWAACPWRSRGRGSRFTRMRRSRAWTKGVNQDNEGCASRTGSGSLSDVVPQDKRTGLTIIDCQLTGYLAATPTESQGAGRDVMLLTSSACVRNVPPTQKRPHAKAVTRRRAEMWHVYASSDAHLGFRGSRSVECELLHLHPAPRDAPCPRDSHPPVSCSNRIHPAPKTFPPPRPKNMFRPPLCPIVVVCVPGCARR